MPIIFFLLTAITKIKPRNYSHSREIFKISIPKKVCPLISFCNFPVAAFGRANAFEHALLF
jgi:hypothetical protein